MRAFFESAFDVVYLVLVVTLGIRMLRKAEGRGACGGAWNRETDHIGNDDRFLCSAVLRLA